MWCGVWRGEGVWSGKGGAQRSGVGEKGGETELGSGVATGPGKGSFFLGKGSGGRGESGSGGGVEKPHRGRDRSEELAPLAATAHAGCVVELGVEAERFFGEWGEQRSRSRLKQSLGWEKEDQERPLHGGRAGAGRTCVVVCERGEEKEWRELWRCVVRKGARRECGEELGGSGLGCGVSGVREGGVGRKAGRGRREGQAEKLGV